MKKLLNTLYITSEDMYLALENDNVVVFQADQRKAMVPLLTLESIISFSYKGASPALMGKCMEKHVSLSFYTPHGRYLCSILGESNRNVLLRREQFRIADKEERSLQFAKVFILGKIFNERWVIERTKRDHAMRVNVDRLIAQSQKLRGVLSSIETCNTIDELRGLEGNAAKEYFYVFDDLILRNKDDFFFEERSRRPPLDPLNALLSFLYSILTRDCAAAVQGAGLDPYVGFMHTDRPGRSSLALDLVEELRAPVVDRFALTLINNGKIHRSDFTEQENGGIFLNAKGRKIVLTAWQQHKMEQITHPFLKEKISWGLVPHVQAMLLARSIRGDLEGYAPFLWK